MYAHMHMNNGTLGKKKMGYKGLLNMCTGFTNVFQAEVLHTVLKQGTYHHHCFAEHAF